MYNYFKVLVSCALIVLQGSKVLSLNIARVVGGTPTDIQKIPYLAQLERDGEFHCGGSLLTPYHVLTAAHCIDGTRPEQLLVKAGASKRTDPGTIRSRVVNFMAPAGFNMKTFDSDVAVLKLATPMTSIPTATLSLKGWKPGDKLQVHGWGALGEFASGPNQLQTATIEVMDKFHCAQMYRNRMILTGSMFCGFAINKNTCYGDSGGPAVVDDKVVGIVSWGIGCARFDSPAVYTDVRTMRSFINYAVQTL